MKNKIVILLTFLCKASYSIIASDHYSEAHSNTVQYIYPIAQIDEECLLVMNQSSLYNIELLKWNKNTRIAQKVLWSIYMPSSVMLLPEKDGFSFLDQGRIRVKYFNKRSPKTVNIFEPITNFDSVHWINGETFYFTAQDPYFHNVFVCQLHKNVASISRLTFQEESDFLYPQKIDEELFVIKRDSNKRFSIVKLSWKENAFDNYKETAGELIVPSDKCCCFLKMINNQKGYFISYVPSKDPIHNTYTFWCNEITKTLDGWEQKEIFSFNVHEKYIIGKEPERMYESIKPLLPCYEKHGIFFSHFDKETKSCSLKKYNIDTFEIEDIVIKHKKKFALFTPFIFDGHAYCGMAIKGSRSFLEKHCIDGDFHFDIFKIEL